MVSDLESGQVWEQKQWPFHSVVVLFVGLHDGKSVFVKMAWQSLKGNLFMTSKEDGSWMWDPDELLADLKSNKYTMSGYGSMRLEPDYKDGYGF